MVLREHREPPVHQALMGPQERAVPQVQAELREAVALMAVRGLQAQVGLPAVAEPLENRGRQEHQEVQAPRAVVDLQEKKAKRGRVVLQAPPAPQVKVAHRALPDHRVTRVVRERVDLPAPLEHQVRMERQGPPVLLALPAAQGHPVQRGMQGVVARQEAQERLRLPEPQVRQAVVALRVKPEPLALPERQVARGPPRLQAVRGQVEVQAPQLRRVLRGRADRLARQEHRQPLHLLSATPLTPLHGMG